MLGKLIKYDLKASARILILIHLLYLVLCISIRLFFINRLDFNLPANVLFTPVLICAVMVFLLIFVLWFSTWLILAFRFYRNLFSGEGYLSWTLPASALEHLWSKIISGYVFLAADTVIVSGGILILVTGENVVSSYQTIAADFTEQLGMPLTTFALYMFVLMLASCLPTVIQTYFYIAAGQLFPGHRVLCSVAIYFITGFVLQFFTLVLMAAFHLMPGYGNTGPDTMGNYIAGTSMLGGVITLVTAFIAYAATHYIMTKKINLL